MFGKFVSRYIIEGELVLVTALHIGAAEDVFKPGGCKNPFFRNATGQPLIPGSSLKGAMRSFLEQYLSSESGKERLPKEMDYRRDICNEEKPCADAKNDKWLEKLLKGREKDSQKQLSNYLFGIEGEKKENGKLCIICRLFGSQYTAAKFSVRDAGVIKESFQEKFEIRSGVAIDRNFGTSIDGKKFETEVVPEGTCFSFRAILENGDEVEWKIIQDILHAMELGMIPIGGMKSRGLGEVKLRNIQYQKIDEKNIADYLSEKKIKFNDLTKENKEE
ncbi:MAG: CRISPR-associated RAMP protein [Lachnospiraceae bacterium]|nr:CRISPR-associated RAMP protein [Lachnospiraceae bacterium]